MGYAAKELKRLMGRALHRHGMIEDGDHVLVAVSGGKDSMTLLRLLSERIRRVPIDYRLTAVHVDPGFGTDCGDRMEDFFASSGFDYRILRTHIGPAAHGPENRENPCFLCSRLRRKRLFQLAADTGCNRIAMGHHKDDLIETFFINVLYGASISTMLPVQGFFQGKLRVIRPLYLVDEDVIRRYAKDMDWPRIDLGCPSAGASKRAEVKSMLARLYRANRKVKGNVFHAIQNVRPEYLP